MRNYWLFRFDRLDKIELGVTLLFIVATLVVTPVTEERGDSLLVGVISLWVFFYLIWAFVGFRHWRLHPYIPFVLFGLYWFASAVLLTLLFKLQGWQTLREMIAMTLTTLLISLLPGGLYLFAREKQHLPIHREVFGWSILRTALFFILLLLLYFI